jgi:hypothetical protein
MLNFCTLFNTNYLAKGLALHQSLVDNCPSFHLYIFAFDDNSYHILTEKNLPHVSVIPLSDFENNDLLSVKDGRSVAEYCWTCTPLTIKHCIDKYQLNDCTYIDADTYFYNDPSVLITEMGNASVLITPHNYYPLYDQSAMSGIYCVQFITFKNTDDGMKVLDWWAQACLTWCYNRYEDGKMGDQKYLDSWPYMFKGVHICRNIGAGLAPWNLLNHPLSGQDKQLVVKDAPLIFYHFHDLQYLSTNTWYLGGYEVPEHALTEIYQPYIKNLLNIDKEIKTQHPNIDSLYTKAADNISALSKKYKLGIYVLDLKTSFKKFMTDLFFTGRRKHYKNNYIQIN